jgi:translation initiation factor IF-1
VSGGVRNALEGVIESAEPRGLYRVRTDDGQMVTASISTQARRVSIRFLPGDRVAVEISPIDTSRGRITKRLS